MCLYPKKMINKKYTATKKNDGIIPTMPIVDYRTQQLETGEYADIPIYDTRIQYIEVPCGQCIECRQTKAREWQARLSEEIKEWKYKYFVTFTFSPEGLQEILFKYKIPECNAAAAHAVRHSLERYRKDFKTSLRHWLITELGHEGTERIHLHGLLMTDQPIIFETIEKKTNGIMAKWKYWKYGIIFVGNYVNQMSVNYMVKYMEKIDNDHKGFIGQILCSPGIGRNYIDKTKGEYKYRPKETKDYYRLPNGSKIKIPKYWKNKALSEEERELVWREFLDSEKISIRGNNYGRSVNNSTISNIINKAQEVSSNLGYGSDSKEWRRKKWNITKNMIRSVAKMETYIQMYEKTSPDLRTPEMNKTYFKYKAELTKIKKNT